VKRDCTVLRAKISLEGIAVTSQVNNRKMGETWVPV